MTSIPMLAVSNFDEPFVVKSDVSGKGIGSCINARRQTSVAYMCQIKSVYAKELMAVVFAIQKWRLYRWGRHFVVHTDQRSLRFLADQRLMGGEQQWWNSKLLGFDFEIKYKLRIENKAADALFLKMQFSALTTTVQYFDWKELEEEVCHLAS